MRLIHLIVLINVIFGSLSSFSMDERVTGKKRPRADDAGAPVAKRMRAVDGGQISNDEKYPVAGTSQELAILATFDSFFFPGIRDSDLKKLYYFMDPKSSSLFNKAVLSMVFTGVTKLIESNILPNVDEVREHFAQRIATYASRLETLAVLNKNLKATRNAIKTRLFEDVVFLILSTLEHADLSNEEHQRVIFEAISEIYFVDNRDLVFQFIHQGNHYGRDLQELCHFNPNTPAVGTVNVSSMVNDGQAILDGDDEAVAMQKRNFLVLFQQLLAKNLLRIPVRGYSQRFDYFAEQNSLELVKNSAGLKSSRGMKLAQIFPWLYGFAMGSGATEFNGDVATYLNFLRDQPEEAQNLYYHEIMRELDNLLVAAKARMHAQQNVIEAGVAPAILQTPVVPAVPFVDQTLQFLARLSDPQAMAYQFAIFEDMVTARLLNIAKDMSVRFPFREIADPAFHKSKDATFQVLAYYLASKANLFNPRVRAEIMLEQSEKFRNLVASVITANLPFDAQNLRDATAEELKMVDDIIADLVRLQLTNTEIFTFVMRTKKFLANNRQICLDVYFSPLNGAQKFYARGFEDIVMHPEQNDANLEMRAFNFLLQLQALWNRIKEMDDPDAWIKALAEKTVGAICMEARSKSLDTASMRLLMNDTPLIKLLLDRTKPINVARNEILRDVFQELNAQFIATIIARTQRFESIAGNLHRRVLELEQAQPRVREQLDFFVALACDEFERQRNAQDYISFLRNDTRERAILQRVFSMFADSFADISTRAVNFSHGNDFSHAQQLCDAITAKIAEVKNLSLGYQDEAISIAIDMAIELLAGRDAIDGKIDADVIRAYAENVF